MISQEQPELICPLTKATARLRRSRQWKDAQSDVKNATWDEISSCDASTSTSSTATASTSSLSTLSSSSSLESLNDTCLKLTRPKGKSSPSPNAKKSTRRRRPKKNKKSAPKVVTVVPELTPEEKARYLALDAEMVGVGPYGYHSRLARISIVNWDGEVVYDTLVQVEEVVTDYRTFVSGITAEDLQSDEAVSFEEAKAHVIELIKDKVVVGHGLRNDFKVLGITHPWHVTRDTAKYEPFMKTIDPNTDYLPPGVPPGTTLIPKKLKTLAKDKLGMSIQEEGVPHSSVEDSVAALELYKKHRVKWERAVAYKVGRTREITSLLQQ